MTRRGIRHLAVVEAGRLIGVISSQDLVLLHGAWLIDLARDIESEASVDGLATIAPRVVAVVRWLVGSRVRAGEIGRLVLQLNCDGVVRRALALVTSALRHGRGTADRPCPSRGSPPGVKAGARRRSRPTRTTGWSIGIRPLVLKPAPPSTSPGWQPA